MTFLLTGTHITPAVALTQEIFSRFPDARVVYIGRKKNKPEKQVEEEEIIRVGAEFIPISFAKFNRFISISILTEFLKIPGGLIRGLILVKQIKPKMLTQKILVGAILVNAFAHGVIIYISYRQSRATD